MSMAQGFFYGDLPPSLQKSYTNDPRTAIAQQLLQQGTSSAPLRGGATEGILRLANALLGGYQQRKLGQEYGQKGQAYNQALSQALAGVKPGHYDQGTGQYIPTDASSILNAGQQNPALAPLAQEFQLAALKSGYSTDADVAAARAKSQYADFRDPVYREFELQKAREGAGARLLGPAVQLYSETGDPTLLRSVLSGGGNAPQQGALPPQAAPTTAPQGRLPSTQGGGLPIAPLPPLKGPAPQSLQGPGAGLDSGGGLPFMPPKNVREAQGKAAVDEVQSAIKAGANADIFLQKTPLYDEAISKLKYTGPLGEAMASARQLGHAIAPNLIEDATPESLVKELNATLTMSANFDPEGKRVFAGNFSDADRNFIASAQAGLGDTREALATKYELAKAVKEREAAVGQLAAQYGNNPTAFAQAKRQLLQQPIIDDAFRQRVAALIGNRKQQLTGGKPQAQVAPPAPEGLPPGSKFLGYE